MSSLDGPRNFLAELAPMSAAAWHDLGAHTFPGELSIATDNSVYRMKNGMFLGRVKKGGRSFEVPPSMRGVRLVGFLFDEGGAWSLSPRWRAGSRAVLWKQGATDEQAFVLTSRTVELTREEPQPRPTQPEPTPSPWATPSAPASGVRMRATARPPSIRQLAAASMTRIHCAMPVASLR
jgi:hypothetical protein